MDNIAAWRVVSQVRTPIGTASLGRLLTTSRVTISSRLTASRGACALDAYLLYLTQSGTAEWSCQVQTGKCVKPIGGVKLPS